MFFVRGDAAPPEEAEEAALVLLHSADTPGPELARAGITILLAAILIWAERSPVFAMIMLKGRDCAGLFDRTCIINDYQ